MKNNFILINIITRTFFLISALLMPILLGISPAHGGVVKTPPLGSGANVYPNVFIIMDSSGSMLCPAYFTKSDSSVISCSGPPGTSSSKWDDGYKGNPPYCDDPANAECLDSPYYGYFDSTKKYSYASNKFYIDPAGTWDGDFLNWVSMRRIDVAKKVLVGGAGTPRARQALAAPNSIAGHQSTNSQFGNYEFIKTHDRNSGVAAGLFPDCGASSGNPCYFGMKDGYVYLDDDSSPFSNYTARYNIDLNLSTEWERGIIQQVSGQVRLGLEYFNDRQGGYIIKSMASPPVDIDFINAIENLDPDTYTPLAESLYTAAGYYGTSGVTGNDGPRYFSAPANSYSTSGANSDPYDFPSQDNVYCAQSFVILITDGTPTEDANIPASPFVGNGNLRDYDDDKPGDDPSDDYLDDIALWAHTTDLRQGAADLAGTQALTLFTLFVFGSGADILKDAAVNGGFIDKNGDNRPTPAHPSDWGAYEANPSVNEWDKNADGKPDNYFAAETGTELNNALRSVFSTIVAMSNTVTAPVIMPGSPGSGNNLYTATFAVNMEHQWEGHLFKYPLDPVTGFLQETSPGSGSYIRLWDAGEILGDTCSGTCMDDSVRKIFTTDASLPVSPNNFDEGNWNNLMPLLGTNTASIQTLLGYTAATDPTYELSTKKLIRFVRGTDVFDEDVDSNITEDRWKLADIFNSGPMETGTPPYFYQDAPDHNYLTDFKTNPTVSARATVVYAGGNDGMLHAFNATTGIEKWAFLPPSLLDNLAEMISPTTNQSISQYFVDSSPVVDDVYIEAPGCSLSPCWRTVLVSGFRWGDRGYFALDVTDPDNPGFLWAVSTDGATVSHWDPSGNRTDLAGPAYSLNGLDYNYTKLGYAWSEPIAGRIKIEKSAGTASDEWVALVGGGYRALQPDVDFDLPNHAAGVGRQVYALRLADGSIVRRFDEGSIVEEAGNGIDNSLPNPLSLIGDSNYYFQYIYAGDREGHLWKMNISGSGTPGSTSPASATDRSQWTSCGIFNAQAAYTASGSGAGNNRRYIYMAPEAALDDSGKRWIFFGTGDARNIRDLYPKLTGAYPADYIANPDAKTGEGNIFIALRDDDPNPSLADGCGDSDYDNGTPADPSDDTPYTTSHLTNVTNDAATMSSTKQGWYLHLAEAEKSFTPPVIYQKVVFLTTFIPETSDICKLGDSYLYVVDFQTGGVVGGGTGTMGSTALTSKKIRIGSGIATAPVIRGGKIQIGMTGTPTATDLTTMDSLGGSWTGNIITLPLPSGLGFNPIKMNYWKDLD